MKKLVCALLVVVLLAGGIWLYTRISRNEIPARGIWDGRTYKNTEAGIKLTVPEKYDIGTDEKIIKTYGFPEDYFDDVKNNNTCLDVFIEDKTPGSYSRMFIEYYLGEGKNTAEQTLNFYKARNTKYKWYYNDDTKPDLNRIYGDNFELTICGQTYICCGFTLEGIEEFYNLICYRETSRNAVALIDIRGKSEEAVNTYLAFFDTAPVK